MTLFARLVYFLIVQKNKLRASSKIIRTSLSLLYLTLAEGNKSETIPPTCASCVHTADHTCSYTHVPSGMLLSVRALQLCRYNKF